MMICGILGGIGLLVSLVAVLLGGVGFPGLIIKPIASAMFMAMLGAGIYFLLRWQMPALFDVAGDDLTELEDISKEVPDTKDDSLPEVEEDLLPENKYDENIYDMDEKLPLPGVRSKRNISGKEGEVVVEGVTLKNQPQVMAETIKALLDQDGD